MSLTKDLLFVALLVCLWVVFFFFCEVLSKFLASANEEREIV